MNRLRYKLVLATVQVPLLGCGASQPSPFERFERLPTVQQLETVDLGEFVVPVPVEVSSDASPIAPTQVQIEFFLHAAVLPEHLRSLKSNTVRLEGRLRDKVIEVCRNTAVEDLLDPQLTTLKARLADSLTPFIGDAHIERIHIADPQVKRL